MHRSIPLLTLFAIGGGILLSSCGTPTQQAMKRADAALVETRQKAGDSDWAAAAQKAGEVKAAVREGVEAKPLRKSKDDKEVDLRPILSAFEQGPHRELESAIQSKNPARLTAACQLVQNQCTVCHTVLGKPETKLTPLLPTP